eukprot:3530826-Heterocapsa_arctica.AAC.1
MESQQDALRPMVFYTCTSNLPWRKPKREPSPTRRQNSFKFVLATFGKPWKPLWETKKPKRSFGKKDGTPNRKTLGS